MPFALALIVLTTAWRVVAAHHPALGNFSPLMALAFCSAVYFKNKRLWLVPFVALTVSDLYLNHHYATTLNYEWTWSGPVIRALCFLAALGFGAMIAHRRTWLNLFSGALGGSLFFYLITNTASFLTDASYVHNFAGWWQAMTVGHPEFAPTILFFRNTLVSDLLFTGIFALAMEAAAKRAGLPSLLGKSMSPENAA